MPNKDHLSKRAGENAEQSAPALNFLGTEQFLSDLVEKRTSKVTEILVLEWSTKKLKTQGVTITKQIVARLWRWLRADGKGEFRATDATGKLVTIKCEFSPAERRSIGKKLERRIVRLVESGAKAAVKTAHKTLRPHYDRSWPKESRKLRKERRDFERRLHDRYSIPFELFAMQLRLSRELGDSINQVIRERWQTGEVAQLVDALSRLHARGCQISCEIAALLRAGYPDGAMARWRSLHEVSVIFEFIRANGADTAVRYLAHDAIESWNAARGYNAMAKRLKHTPYTDAEMAKMKATANTAVATYGPEFESEYGWAAKALKNRRPKFAEIERAVELDHFRPYYKFASHNVHANPKGVLYRLSTNGDQSIMPTGPSNLGFTPPGNNASLTLNRITVGYANFAESLDALCVVSMLCKLPGQIGKAFVQAERMVEADEARIHRMMKKSESDGVGACGLWP